MSTNIGSRFAILSEAPAEWNAPGLVPDSQIAVRSTGGEGFVVELFSKTFRESLLKGGNHWIYTAHIVREDAEILFGFESVAERALFLELRDIDSIGPKTAAQILAGLGRDHLADLVHGRSLAGVKISGVGPKTLEKLASGIKLKREKFLALLTAIGVRPDGARADRVDEVPFSIVQGLEKLGLRREDVVRVYRDIAATETQVHAMPASEIIRLVLQRWGQYKSKIQPHTVEGIV